MYVLSWVCFAALSPKGGGRQYTLSVSGCKGTHFFTIIPPQCVKLC